MSEKAGVRRLSLSSKLLKFFFATSQKQSNQEKGLCYSRFWYIYFTASCQTKKGFNHFFITSVGFVGGDAFRFSGKHWQYSWAGAKEQDFWNVWWWEKQDYANLSHIVGRLPFVKQTTRRNEPVCKCNASDRERATHDQTQAVLPCRTQSVWPETTLSSAVLMRSFWRLVDLWLTSSDKW